MLVNQSVTYVGELDQDIYHRERRGRGMVLAFITFFLGEGALLERKDPNRSHRPKLRCLF